MAAKKWLNIVVDGNCALSPYWSTIVSDYLDKFIRSFFDNSRRRGDYSSCEVSLIVYNFNPRIGNSIQYISWTNDMNQFINFLPFLPFNGENLNQHTIAEGLAEALVMFPKPEEYFEYERHCVLVATGEPVPKKMLVSLPMVHESRFLPGQFKVLNANFMKVAKMFLPLRVSLSLITPNYHPSFISIFNSGNGLAEDTPVTNYGNGQIIALVSINFKEAHPIHSNKEIVGSSSKAIIDLESLNTFDDTLSIISTNNFNLQGNLFSASSNMTVGGQSNEGVHNVGYESTSNLAPFIPTSEERQDPLTQLLEQEQPSLEEILGQVLRSPSTSEDGLFPLNNNPDSSEPEVSYGWSSEAGSSFVGFPDTGNDSDDEVVGPSASVADALFVASSGAIVVAGAGADADADAGVVAVVDNANAYYDSTHHQQFQRNHRLSMMPHYNHYNQTLYWPKPPTDFRNYLQAWEGCLIGKIQSYCESFNLAKCLRKQTSPAILTNQWPSTLDIILLLPRKAVNYTMGIYGGPIDHVFFQVTHFNNPDLHQHLMINKSCAKIDLQFYSIILSATDIMHQYLGSIFPRETIFMEAL